MTKINVQLGMLDMSHDGARISEYEEPTEDDTVELLLSRVRRTKKRNKELDEMPTSYGERPLVSVKNFLGRRDHSGKDYQVS